MRTDWVTPLLYVRSSEIRLSDGGARTPTRRKAQLPIAKQKAMRANPTFRCSRRKAPPSPHQDDDSSQLREVLSGKSKVDASGQVIRASKTRHGPRQRWGPVQYVQAKILAIHPAGPPKSFNAVHLTREVNEQLSKDAEWRASGYGRNGKVSRPTVLRAVKLLLKP
jgi:hypothetical protein